MLLYCSLLNSPLRSPPYLGVDAVSVLSAADVHSVHVHDERPLPRSALQPPRAVR